MKIKAHYFFWAIFLVVILFFIYLFITTPVPKEKMEIIGKIERVKFVGGHGLASPYFEVYVNNCTYGMYMSQVPKIGEILYRKETSNGEFELCKSSDL